MNSTRSWSVGILLISIAFLTAVQSVNAETWKARSDTWQTAAEEDGSPAALNWQQRVLKRPVSAEKPAVSRSVEPAVVEGAERIARRSSYERGTYGPAEKMTRRPIYSARRPARLANNDVPEVIPPGATEYEPIAEEGVFADDGCGGYDCNGDCGACDCAPSGECCDFGYECFDGRCDWWFRNLTVFVGGQGFKGPLDWGTNGNFGFNEGLGISGPLGDPWGCGYQMGARFTQSDVYGLPASAPGTDRTQYFVTAGVFRRELCRGLQWSAVWDYMHDRYYDTFKLHQIRADVGFVLDPWNELGFLGTFGANTDTYNFGNFNNIVLDPTDMYALYFRRNFENGGDGRFWGGATGRGDGIIGADLWVPLGKGFALQNIINYKLPKEGRAHGAHADESWGLTIQLVWYPGQSALSQRCNPYRPMANVADNGLFMVDQIIR
ncbi:MAG: hypothetical protein JW959_10480 [Pirellulales bacterium]|nr:hypothetical protein [Pirellulales bacterium]